MNRIKLISLLLLTSFVSFGQSKVVDWSYETKTLASGEIEITFTADIEDGWKLYSQHTAEGGPLPTEFFLEPAQGVELIGDVAETSKAKTELSDLFEIDVTSFTEHANFVQKVRTKNNGSQLKATISYMCCDGNRCLPPTDKTFNISL